MKKLFALLLLAGSAHAQIAISTTGVRLTSQSGSPPSNCSAGKLCIWYDGNATAFKLRNANGTDSVIPGAAGGAVDADSPLGGDGSSGSHLTCTTCVTLNGSQNLDNKAIVTAGGAVQTLGYDSSNGFVIGNTIINHKLGGNSLMQMESGTFHPGFDYTSGGGRIALGTLTQRFYGLFNHGQLSGSYNSQSGTTYTVAISDFYVGMSNTAARTVTLCAAAAITDGQWIVIKDEAGTAASANITVAAGGGDSIDASASITTNKGSVRLMSDGVSKWFTF